MIRRPPRSTLSSSSAASDVYKRQLQELLQVGCHGDCHQQHNRELEVVVVGLEVEAGRVEHQAEQSQSSRVPLIRARIAATARSLSLPLLMISMVSMRLIRSPASSDLTKSSAVCLALFCNCGSACARRSECTTSVCPWCAAQCSGAIPNWPSGLEVSALAESSNWTHSVVPHQEAQISGVREF
eukprot:TRINITY_DN5747_c0_g1_i3.p2 TRINITY_DN5747_c0_g1~~TRINITY_DN5747_c0_g1_i3.p2  ORF type:complete len:184 (+),score=26.70 TRINITY_DN5747_c0_g1_i3:116-667(+)